MLWIKNVELPIIIMFAQYPFASGLYCLIMLSASIVLHATPSPQIYLHSEVALKCGSQSGKFKFCLFPQASCEKSTQGN